MAKLENVKVAEQIIAVCGHCDDDIYDFDTYCTYEDIPFCDRVCAAWHLAEIGAIEYHNE